MASLYDAFRRSFERDPHRVRIEAGERTLDGNDLAQGAERWAAALASLGVAKGDRVALQVEKSIEALFVYLGTIRLGAAILPLNTAYRRGEIGYFLDDAEPRVFICDPKDAAEFAPLADAAGATLLTLDAAGRGTMADRAGETLPPAPAVDIAPHDLAAILYTSGTTGRSKGAMLSQANLLSNAETLIAAWAIDDGDVLVHALPIFHIHGLFVALNTTLVAGARIRWLPRFEAARVVEALPGATLFMGVPTYYVRLLTEPGFDRDATASIRLFVSGSAPLLEETFRAVEGRTGQRILERYGMTEAGMICSNPLSGERRPGTVGPPLPGIEVRLGAAEGEDVGIGVLEVRGPNVFQGYWRMPEKTADEFRSGGWFVTGDVARIDPDGYVRIVGRAKDLIICGGLNVYPKEIEERIDALPGIFESAVIGLPHPDFGEAVAAVVTAKPGMTPLDSAGIIQHLKGELAGFKVPKAVFLVEELPRNTMGKVQKNVLRDRYKGTFVPGTA